MVTPPKCLFADVCSRSFLDGLKVAPGEFVATRLQLRLGARITLSLKLATTSRRLEVPAVVVGRRTPASPQSSLMAGVIIRIADPFHPNLKLAEALLDGRVVDFQDRQRQVRPPPATASFLSADELLSEVSLLRDGGAAQIPLDRPVTRGERLLVTLTLEPAQTRGQPRPPMPAAAVTCIVVVKGVVRHDEDTACMAELADATDVPLLDAFVRAILGQGGSNGGSVRA